MSDTLVQVFELRGGDWWGFRAARFIDLHDGTDLDEVFRWLEADSQSASAPETPGPPETPEPEATDLDLIDGMSAWQCSIGLSTPCLYTQMAELYARRVGPSLQRLAAAQATGSRRDAYLAKQDVDLDVGAVEDEVALTLSWSRVLGGRWG